MWLFGNTQHHNSIALRVLDFKFYFFVEKPDHPDSFTLSLEEAVGANVLQEISECARLPVIGYSYKGKWGLLKVVLTEYGHLKKVLQFLEQEMFTVDRKPKILGMYHHDWDPEALFLHETGLKLQGWVAFTKSSRVFPHDKLTTCQLERTTSLASLHAVDPPTEEIPILLCSVNVMVHQTCDAAGNRLPPDPLVPDNRILGIYSEHRWLSSAAPAFSRYYTGDENTLISSFLKDAVASDVDTYLFLTEQFNPLVYLLKRATGVHGPWFRGGPQLSKFTLVNQYQNLKYNLWEKGGGFPPSLKTPGRTRFDLLSAVKKMQIQPPLEGHTFKHIIHHPRILKDPGFAGGYLDQEKQGPLASLRFLNQGVCSVEQDNNLFLNCLELSKACATGITTINEGGQQIRVWNKLKQNILGGCLLFNQKDLGTAPYVEKVPRDATSYPDVPAFPNVPFSERGGSSGKKRKQLDLFGRPLATKKSKTSKPSTRSQGGCVFAPEKGMYSRPTLLLDFASLYPSIIQSDQVCPMRLVLDNQEAVQITSDPNVEVDRVPLSDTECFLMVSTAYGEPVPTMLDGTTKELCEERRRIKRRKLDSEKGSFKYHSLDAAEKACKVCQNALYGTLGVSHGHSKFSIPVLMKMVCVIGQRMINQVKHWLLTKHGGYLVYGDTDSVLVQFQHPEGVEQGKEVLDWAWNLGLSLEKEALAMFKPPHCLELEKVISKLILFEKKMYAMLEYTTWDFTQPPALNYKGLPSSKRDKCPWVRTIGDRVVQLLLGGKTVQEVEKTVLAYIDSVCGLVLGQAIPLVQLEITCCMKNLDDYKNENLIQKVTAEKILHRDGKLIQEGDRLAYLIVQGDRPLYERGETIEHIQRTGQQPDWDYYINRQLLTSLQFLLQFLPGLGRAVTQKVSTTLHQIGVRQSGVRQLSSFKRRDKKDHI